MANRFQNQKINKDDHKDIRQVAGGVKKGVGLMGVAVVVCTVIKKYGKTALQVAKTLILRK